jgi:cell division septum initiation protein DivIVA
MEKKMDRILSMGGRLNKLLEEAEAEADKIVSEARAEADAIINKAQEEANYRLSRAQRGTGIDDLIEEEEKKAQTEAQQVKERYKSRLKEIENVNPERKNETIGMIIEEVIPE